MNANTNSKPDQNPYCDRVDCERCPYEQDCPHSRHHTMAGAVAGSVCFVLFVLVLLIVGFTMKH